MSFAGRALYNYAMSDSHTKEATELKHVLEHIDKGGKDECVMCRFVLIFAFIVLLLVLTFTFFFRMENAPTVEPPTRIPKAETPLPTNEESNARIMELGQILGYPEAFPSDPKNPPQTVKP